MDEDEEDDDEEDDMGSDDDEDSEVSSSFNIFKGWHNDASFPIIFKFTLMLQTLLTKSPFLLFFGQVEDSLEEIDPSAIVPQGRRTRGVRVDYTSKEALEKAGLQDDEGEESDEDVMMKD